VGVYFEAGAVIIVLVLLGQVMELGARERTGSAIRALLDLAAKTARVIRADGREEEIRSRKSSSATMCGCGRATRCRWMAW
jgi:Cu+-exporting ATPase